MKYPKHMIIDRLFSAGFAILRRWIVAILCAAQRAPI